MQSRADSRIKKGIDMLDRRFPQGLRLEIDLETARRLATENASTAEFDVRVSAGGEQRTDGEGLEPARSDDCAKDGKTHPHFHKTPVACLDVNVRISSRITVAKDSPPRAPHALRLQPAPGQTNKVPTPIDLGLRFVSKSIGDPVLTNRWLATALFRQNILSFGPESETQTR